jgi:hypothetical protein
VLRVDLAMVGLPSDARSDPPGRVLSARGLAKVSQGRSLSDDELDRLCFRWGSELTSRRQQLVDYVVPTGVFLGRLAPSRSAMSAMPERMARSVRLPNPSTSWGGRVSPEARC